MAAAPKKTTRRLSLRRQHSLGGRDGTKEWIPTRGDVLFWRTELSNGKLDVSAMKRYLRKNKLFVGRGTVDNGLTHILHEACLVDHDELVKYLLKLGANDLDINALVKYHPLSYHYRSDEQMTVQEKLDQYSGTLIHAAAEGGSLRVLKQLIAAGASVNTVNCCSESPLIVALVNMREEAALFLIESGAKVDYQTSEGMTPLMYAATIPSMVNVIAPLVAAGCNVQLTDSCGYTALHHAFLAGNVSSVKVLLSLGISPTFAGGCPAKSPAYLADHHLYFNRTICGRDAQSHYHSILADVLEPYFSKSVEFKTHLLEVTVHLSRFYEDPASRWRLRSDWSALDGCKSTMKDSLELQSKLPEDEMDPEAVVAYGDEVEAWSLDQWKKQLKTMPTSTLRYSREDLVCQCLLVRENCLGFGDTTVIDLLLKLGNMFFNLHQRHKALVLWVRASKMVYHCLTQKGLCQIRELPLTDIMNLLKFCIEGGELGQILSNHKSSDQLALFISISIDNTAQHILLTQTKWHYHHTISVTSSIEMVNILVAVFDCLISYRQSNETKGFDIDRLGEKFVKCCKGPIVNREGWSTSLLLLAHEHKQFFKSEMHIRQLLLWGAHEYINEPGVGYRFLHVIRRRSIASLALDLGAHSDAVDMYGNTALEKDISHPTMYPLFEITHPRPLTCLSAIVVVETGIPYKSLPFVSPRIKTFISYHDPASVVPDVSSML